MRFSTALIALVFGTTAMVSASPAYVEYVTVTQGATENEESTPQYSVESPTTYQVSSEMPESDLYKMLCLVNKCRAAHGKTPLAFHKSLVKSSQAHSQYMARVGKMTHDDYRGGLGDRITSDGFPSWSTVSENIASGQNSVKEVVDAWIESPGHLSNILGDTVYCGFGRVGNMWTQEFASPSGKSLYPEGSQPVCPSPDSKPVSSPTVEHTQDVATYETVEQTHDYTQEQRNPVKYITQYIQGYHNTPVQDYTPKPRVVNYVTQYVKVIRQQPSEVYHTIEPVENKSGCD